MKNIPGEIGQELREAYVAYVTAPRPRQSRDVVYGRYFRISKALAYLQAARGLTHDQIAEIRLDDLPPRAEVYRYFHEEAMKPYPGEVGKEFHEARDTFLKIPIDDRTLDEHCPAIVRYQRIRGSLGYLLFKRKLTKDEIADIKLADLPGVKKERDCKRERRNSGSGV